MTSTLAFDIIAKDRASGTFDKFGNAVKGAGDKSTESGGKVSAFGGKIGGLVGKLGLAGGALAGITATIAGIGDAMSREVSTDRLAASLGATPKMAERVGKISSRLYAGAWGESMDEVAHAVEAAATSFDGLSAGGLQKASRQAMDYSKIFEVDLPKATMVAGQAVKTGLAKNASEAFDLMTAASQRVPASLREDVLDAGNEYGQFFAGLGFSGEQAFAMLAKGAEKGTYGIDKVGDAIKEFTIRSTDGSKASTEAYKAIGLDAEAMATKIVKGGKGAATATSDIVNGLLKMKDPAKQAQTAIALFGTPLEDLNVKDIPDFLKSMQAGTDGMDKWKGSIDRAGETLNDNAATKLEGFKRKAQTAFVDFLGSKAVPAIEKAAGFLQKNLVPAVERAGDWFRTKMLPPLRDFAEKAAPKARDVMNAVKGAFQDSKPFIELVGKVLTNVVVPGFKKVLDVAGPALVNQIKAVGKILRFVGEAGTWMWNNALQPAFKFMVKGIGWVLDGWSAMLEVLGKVPGFGWAKDASIAMGKAADKAYAMAEGIKKIPPKKTVTITTIYMERNAGKERRMQEMGIDPRGRMGARLTGESLMSLLAEGMKQGGKKVDKVLAASRDRIKAALSTVRDDMKSLSESIASALNPDAFSFSDIMQEVDSATGAITTAAQSALQQSMAQLTGTNSALSNLKAVFGTLQGGASKGFLSSIMQSGNVALMQQYAADPAALAEGSRLFDANAALASSLGDQAADAVLGDRIDEALSREVERLLKNGDDLPKKIRKELKEMLRDGLELRVVGGGQGAGQAAYLRGAWT